MDSLHLGYINRNICVFPDDNFGVFVILKKVTHELLSFLAPIIIASIVVVGLTWVIMAVIQPEPSVCEKVCVAVNKTYIGETKANECVCISDFGIRSRYIKPS